MQQLMVTQKVVLHLSFFASVALACSEEREEPASGVDAVDELETDEGDQTVVREYPVEVITLPNGNLLQLFVGDDDGVLVMESGFSRDSTSALDQFGDEQNGIEIWQALAPRGEPLHPRLVEAAAREGVDLGDGRGLGAAYDLVAVSDPLAGASWCDGVGDDQVQTILEHCTPGSGYEDGTCHAGGMSTLSHPAGWNISMATAYEAVRGGWCQSWNPGLSEFTLQYTGCGAVSWTGHAPYIDDDAEWNSFVWSSPSVRRRYRLIRMPLFTVVGYAAMGLKWSTDITCV